MIFTILMVAIVIACILLTIIILAQNPKGGGLSGAFGGTSSASIGIQRTNDFMEKTTWTLGIVIVVLIFLSVVLTAKPSTMMVPTSVPTTTTNAMPQNEVQSSESVTSQEAK